MTWQLTILKTTKDTHSIQEELKHVYTAIKYFTHILLVESILIMNIIVRSKDIE
jgi:hypothetical protein